MDQVDVAGILKKRISNLMERKDKLSNELLAIVNEIRDLDRALVHFQDKIAAEPVKTKECLFKRKFIKVPLRGNLTNTVHKILCKDYQIGEIVKIKEVFEKVLEKMPDSNINYGSVAIIFTRELERGNFEKGGLGQYRLINQPKEWNA